MVVAGLQQLVIPIGYYSSCYLPVEGVLDVFDSICNVIDLIIKYFAMAMMFCTNLYEH